MARENSQNNTQQKTTDAKHVDQKNTYQAQQVQVEAMLKKALEQLSKSVDTFSVFTRDNLEALVQSAGAASKNTEVLVNEIVSSSKQTVEDSVAAIKDLSNIRTPDAWVNLQTRYSQQYIETNIAQANKIFELVTSASREISAPISARYNAWSELVNAFAVNSAKSA